MTTRGRDKSAPRRFTGMIDSARRQARDGGQGLLFMKFSGIDVFDIEIAETDPDRLVDIIASLEPTFGGINLEDIKAPECFEIERRLRERIRIPVFHTTSRAPR